MVVDIPPRAQVNGYEQMLEAMATLDLARIERRPNANKALESAIPDHCIRAFIGQNVVINSNTEPY